MLATVLGGLGLGRLPGDLQCKGGNVRVYVPIMSTVVVSIVLTALVNVLVRR